ncbi:MAG: DHH family phosphoesterase [Patescibacteria group bacterium]|jgi:phosphoesterase RecJ-like protein
MNHFFHKAGKEINQAKNILLITHFNPDGDAIASVCAMIDYLESKKKEYLAFCHTPVPKLYKFIPHAGKIKNSGEIDLGDKKILDDFDLILIFDCAEKERTAVAKIGRRPLSQKIIEFDHHPGVETYAQIELRDTLASSTSEVIYNFFKANGIKIGPRAATCILTGIVTDTGAFLYPSATLKSIKIGSEMLLSGACHAKIIDKYLRNKSLPALKGWGDILDKMLINRQYSIGVAILTHEQFTEKNISEEEYEGLSGFISNLSGVRAVLFLRQTEPGIVRGSLRAGLAGDDVSALARILGGGGHKAAAGFSLKGRLLSGPKGWKII